VRRKNIVAARWKGQSPRQRWGDLGKKQVDGRESPARVKAGTGVGAVLERGRTEGAQYRNTRHSD